MSLELRVQKQQVRAQSWTPRLKVITRWLVASKLVTLKLHIQWPFSYTDNSNMTLYPSTLVTCIKLAKAIRHCVPAVGTMSVNIPCVHQHSLKRPQSCMCTKNSKCNLAAELSAHIAICFYHSLNTQRVHCVLSRVSFHKP